MLYFIICVWASIFVLIFMPPILDVFKRKNRSKTIELIADSINWKYTTQRRTPRSKENTHLLELNILENFIENMPAQIADLPSVVQVEMYQILRGKINATSPRTILTLNWQENTFPPFELRPREWSDRFATPPILGENFVVESLEREAIHKFFPRETIEHYDQGRQLYISAKENTIEIRLEKDKYLPATKEAYLNLIAEGAYLIQNIQAILISESQ